MRHKKSSTVIEDFCELAGTRTQDPPDYKSGCSTDKAAIQLFNIKSGFFLFNFQFSLFSQW